MVNKRTPFVIAPAALMMLLISIAGCPGTMPPPSGNGNGGGNGGNGDPSPTGVSFKDDVEPILTSVCGSCHTDDGDADSAGIDLRLDGSDNFDALFNDSSIQDANLKFVVAGDPDNSFVYLKVSQDNPPLGPRMPLAPIPALTITEQEMIRRWIEAGAEDN